MELARYLVLDDFLESPISYAGDLSSTVGAGLSIAKLNYADIFGLAKRGSNSLQRPEHLNDPILGALRHP